MANVSVGSRGHAAGGEDRLSRNERLISTREQNINAAKAIADTIRTSLGPRGMDKMIEDPKGGVVITNDGATIMKELHTIQPAARMLVELSKAQDVEAGDGTTSVVVFAGALLQSALELLQRGLHPQTVAGGYLKACEAALKILQSMSIPVDLSDRESLMKAASTSFNSKVVSQLASQLAPLAVDAVMKVVKDPKTAQNVDLKNVRVVKVVGGTLDDTELVDGLILSQQRVSRVAGGPTKITDANIGLIQFCLSLPKTDMESTVTIKDYQSMDRLLRQERLHIAKMVKQIASTGCNVLLIQKSILRDAVTDLALDFLAKAKILVVRDIEREDVEFIYKTLGCHPVASLDHFTADKLGKAQQVVEQTIGDSKVVKFTGVPSDSTVSVLLRASHGLTLDEADRSLHDALCVVRSLVKSRSVIPGGGAPEMEISQKLREQARTMADATRYCYLAFADAIEAIPYTLAENAGVTPALLITQLRAAHAEGHKNAGIDVKKGIICNDMVETFNVLQPQLVTKSVISLATETVTLILKIDDVVLCK